MMLEELPETIGKVLSMKWLILSDNRLTRLPDSILNLSNLEYINLESNFIADLPVLTPLEKLFVVYLEKNFLDCEKYAAEQPAVIANSCMQHEQRTCESAFQTEEECTSAPICYWNPPDTKCQNTPYVSPSSSWEGSEEGLNTLGMMLIAGAVFLVVIFVVVIAIVSYFRFASSTSTHKAPE